MAKLQPTARTLAWLRGQRYDVGVVEKWNAHIKIRQDLFGFADLIAFKAGEPVLLVQATSGANTATRVKKIAENETAMRWVGCGHRIIVVGWRQLVQRKKDGTKAKLKKWTVKVEEITTDTFRR